MTIIICPTKKNDGFGDIVFMINVANTLVESDINQDVIIVSHLKNQIINLFNSQINPMVQIMEEKQATNANLSPSLFIQGPTYHRSYSRFCQNDNTIPTLYMGEYSDNDTMGISTPSAAELAFSMPKQNKYVSVILSGLCNYPPIGFGGMGMKIRVKKKLGIPLKDDGIFIDNNLVNKGKSYLENPVFFTNETLRELSIHTQRIISGYFLQENHAQNIQYYFYYGHNKDSYNAYVKLVMAKNKNNHNSIVIFTVGEASHFVHDSTTQAWIRNAGFTNVLKLDDDENINKSLLFIPFNSLEHNDFIKLMSIADGIVGVTGDQSFSEALALGKVPVYELRPHKKQFYRAFIALVEKLQLNELKNLLDVFFIDDDKDKEVFTSISSNEIPDNITTLANINLNEQMDLLLNCLKTNWNLNITVIERVKDVLAKPQIHPAYTYCIEKLSNEMNRLSLEIDNPPKLFFFKKNSHYLLELITLYGQICNQLAHNPLVSPGTVITNFFPNGCERPLIINELIQYENQLNLGITFYGESVDNSLESISSSSSQKP